MKDQVASLYAASKVAYWQDKDLPKCIALAQEGISLALANDLRGEAKAISYDLASFCWDGWNEPDIAIGPAELAIGEEAAYRNLALAIELNRPALPMANAHFMVGAYHLSFRRYEPAMSAFAEFLRFAEQIPEDPALVLLGEGYFALAEKLAGAPADDFNEVVEELKGSDINNAKFFADQLATADKVFAKN